MKRPEFFTGFIASLVVFFSGQAFAQGSPEAFAKKFLDQASRADKGALEMLDETVRKQYEQGFADKAKLKWGVPAGYVSVSYPEILAETRRGDWALYVFRRELLAATDTAVSEKKSYDAKIEKYFPEDQRPGARKTVNWNGNTLETLVPAFLVIAELQHRVRRQA